MGEQQAETITVSQLLLRIQQLETLLLEKTRQLDEVTRELDDFSFAVSHDLKAPVRALAGFSGILKEEQYDRLDDEGRRVTGIIENNARKLGEMIEAMVSHSGVSKKNIIYRDVDMKAMAETTLGMLLTVNEKAVLNINITALPTAFADENMIKQVWLNVFNMALLQAGENNYNSLLVEFEEDSEATTYCIKSTRIMQYEAVAGNRQLINAGIRQHLEGHGTGSAFVKRVIFKHNGNFWVQTIPGSQCAFYFSLPKKVVN
ncbi:MAG TPA: histidine kinase dimerization/phospho-acceptor domain-containing protein [Chitinophagaceae bacterium]|nr:histidine kinase dimerization/phospho-acceptor domain-containing protein [Chitinophagaceae bacterium]